MKFYMAPMEGITGYIYRNALNRFFGDGIDKFYTPFLVPHIKREFSNKELNEISSENNKGINLVPQILTNNAEDFTRLSKKLRELGFEEVNLNLGCPSRTVVSKKRGSGALADIEELERFLDGIFAGGDSKISIKTRIGVETPDEFEKIIRLYNNYPIMELTIHPRITKQMYSGLPNRDIFNMAMEIYRKPVCYNGDIFSVSDYERFLIECDIMSTDNVGAVMIGRGVLRNPSLIRELTGGSPATNEEIKAFLREMRENYGIEMSGQTPVLFKMKELWSNLQYSFPEKEKLCKKLLKTKSLAELDVLSNQILSE